MLLYRRIDQVAPQLQAVDVQHRLNGKRWSTTQRLVCIPRVRRNQRHRLAPGMHLVYLVGKDLLAGLLWQRIQAKDHLRHESHPA